MSTDDDVERLGEYRAPVGEPPDAFATLWQTTEHLSSATEAFEGAVEALLEDELIVQAPEGEAVEVDLEDERQKIRDYLDRLRAKLDNIEDMTREGG